MKKNRHLRGKLFDIERQLRTRNLGADEAISGAMVYGKKGNTAPYSENMDAYKDVAKKAAEKGYEKMSKKAIAKDVAKEAAEKVINISDKKISDKQVVRKNTNIAATETSEPLPKGIEVPGEGVQKKEWLAWKQDQIKIVIDRLTILMAGDSDRADMKKGKLYKKRNFPDTWRKAKWDFLHWMTEGEMPNSYGFGLKVRDYYFSLSELHREEFDKVCIKEEGNFRAASTITWIIDRFPVTNFTEIPNEFHSRVTLLNHIREKQEEKIGTKNLEGYGEYEKEMTTGKAENLLKTPNQLVDTWLKKLSEVIKNYGITNKTEKVQEDVICNEIMKNPDLIALIADFRLLGHGMRKVLPARLKNKSAKDAMLKFSQELKEILIKTDKDYHLEFGSRDGNDLSRSIFRLTFGEIGRAWGDTTAALGLHPYGLERLETTHSSLATDFGKMKSEVKENSTSWCDMNAQGGLWSLSANLDRYRDTKVTLHLLRHGSDIARGSDVRGTSKQAATFSELLMSLMSPTVIIHNNFLPSFKKTSPMLKNEHLQGVKKELIREKKYYELQDVTLTKYLADMINSIK